MKGNDIDTMEDELKTIEEYKKIPDDIKKEINKKVYENILIITIIMAICVLLLLGFKNIWPDEYLIILRILAGIMVASTLVLIERAYKKDSAKLALNAAEIVVVSFGILALPHLYIFYRNIFPPIVTFSSSILGIYYAIKGITIIFRERKKYRKSVSDLENNVEE